MSAEGAEGACNSAYTRAPSESKFMINIFGKQMLIMTSGDVTGLALLFDVMLLCLMHEFVRVLYSYMCVYMLSSEMSGRTRKAMPYEAT